MKREPPAARDPSGAPGGGVPGRADAEGAAPGGDLAPLRFVVEGEARRALSEVQIAADPARIADGWTRRFIVEGARAAEMAALYESLGFEVTADPIAPDNMSGDCEDCALVMRLRFVMLYTRKRRG